MTRLLDHWRIAVPLAAALFTLACEGKPGEAPKADSSSVNAPPPAPADTNPSGAPTPAELAAGQEGYMICQTCHQAEGQGVPGTYPPLAGSDVVNGPPEVMIAIVLKGLIGPVTVAGKPYDNVMAPWESLSDEQIAATITYERNSWGNRASRVTTDQVARVRAAIASRTTPWTIAELEKATLK